MRKFKIISIILIILILIVGAIYIFAMRSTNVRNSKTFKLFEQFNFYPEEKQVTIKMDYSSDEIDFHWTMATDFKNSKEVLVQDIDFKDRNGKAKMIYVTDDRGQRTTVVNTDEKTYRDFGVIDDTTFENVERCYSTWFLNPVGDSKYYTRGYTIIDGQLLYYENFNKGECIFYYKKDELKYIKLKAFEDGYNGKIKDGLVKVTVSYDDSYKKEIEIPDNYKPIITKTTIDEDGNEQIEYEIKEISS